MKPAPAACAALFALAACAPSAASTERSDTPLDAVRVGLPSSEPVTPPPPAGAKAEWVAAGAGANYGYAGQAPLLSLECRAGTLFVTRHVAAEVGAQALFALQGGGVILRLPVDAFRPGAAPGYEWQGSIPAAEPGTKVFEGAFSGTLPGGGRIEVTPGDPARELLRRCREAAA